MAVAPPKAAFSRDLEQAGQAGLRQSAPRWRRVSEKPPVAIDLTRGRSGSRLTLM
jgi:hypothetical protein